MRARNGCGWRRSSRCRRCRTCRWATCLRRSLCRRIRREREVVRCDVAGDLVDRLAAAVAEELRVLLDDVFGPRVADAERLRGAVRGHDRETVLPDDLREAVVP